MTDISYIKNMDMKFIETALQQDGYSSLGASISMERYRAWLIVAAEHEHINLTPSLEIDAAWHIHLKSERYQSDCMAIFGYVMEHSPIGESDEAVIEGWTNTLALLPEIATQQNEQNSALSGRAGCVRSAGCVRMAGCVRKAASQAIIGY